jgi:ABC-type multidrug transport system ATPase subunit
MNLSISNLSKTYANGVRALQDVSLDIPAGMFGLLGPNGAGKSTLMRTIATLQQPDTGSIRLGDRSTGSGQAPSAGSGQGIDVLTQPEDVRKILGYLPQEFGLYPNLSAERVLDHFAEMKGVANRGERRDLVHALLKQTNLWDARKKAVGGFSGGMKQRLGIAIALAGRPQLVIVDEPTAGLDPNERHRFLNLLSEIGDDVIVILSTHIVEDVRELCRRMAIINQGQVVLQGDPQQVLDEVRGHIWRKRISKSELATFQATMDVISVRLVAGDPVIHVYSDSSPGDGFTPVEPNLEDVYLHRVGIAALAEA